MSVQLREPCTRSIRHLFTKPWPTLINRSTTRRLTCLFQGKQHTATNNSIPLNNHKWPLLISSSTTTTTTRSYTTSVALRSMTEEVSTDPAILESTMSKINQVSSLSNNNVRSRSNKKNASKLWAQYQQTFSESKETLDVKQYDTLMTALVEKATTSKKTGFWIRIIQAYKESKTLSLQPSATMYRAALKAYGKTRDMGQVIATFKEYKKRFRPTKATAYHHYMTAVLNCGEMNTAHRIFARDIHHNPAVSQTEASLCLADLVSFCIKKNNLILALKATESLLPVDGWDKEALNQVTQSLWHGYSSLLFSTTNTPITPLSVESFVSLYIEKSATATTTTKDNKLFIPSHLFTLFNLICHSNNSNNFVPTVKTCNLVLDSQAMDQHFGRVKSILAILQKLEIDPSLETVSVLARTFGDDYTLSLCTDSGENNNTTMNSKKWRMEEFKKRGKVDTEAAMDWLSKTNCQDLDCYAMVMESFIQAGQFNKCILEYDRLKVELPHLETNRRIVKSLLTARLVVATADLSQDWNLVRDLKISMTPNTVMRILHTLINLETKYGAPMVDGKQIIKSLQLLETQLDMQLSAEGISRIITSLGKRGDVENGYRLYKYVRSSSGSEKQQRCSSSHIYRAMMASATKNNDLRKLERAWVDMQYRNQYLDCNGEERKKELHALTAYNILLNGYASRQPRPDLTRVKRVFQRLLNQGLTPDQVTYNILIKAFVNANNMEAANQIFRKMIHSGTKPDHYTTNTLLNGWIIRKDWNRVEDFVQELKSSTKKSTCSMDMVTFNLIVQSFLQLDSKSMNYVHLLKHQHKWSHIQQVEQHQKQQINTMSSSKIWNIFESTTGYQKSQLNNKKPLQAHEDAFVKLFSDQAEADQVTYKLFMKAFVNIGNYKSAHKVYQWMKKRSPSSSSSSS